MYRARRSGDRSSEEKSREQSPLMSPTAIESKWRPHSLTQGRFRMLAIFLAGAAIFITLSSALGSMCPKPTFELPDEFPRKIWQSWKVDPLRFADRDIERARTWTVKNPLYRYEVLTDDNAVPYVELHFGPAGFNRPDIVAAYKAMSAPNTRIIQADLLRYILLYVEGGVWADIDVEALRPVDQWIPKAFHERDINMIIGIETDEPDFVDHPFLGAKAQSFCQWTFACKPRVPVMLQLIENILEWLNDLSREQGRPISHLELDFDTVLVGTGPSAFTNAILKDMAKVTGDRITWEDFHGMEESKVVGNILVLPSEAYAAGTGHSNSGNHGGHRALVKHHFGASSWTTHHQRYKHPVYDQVEKCNWDAECVRLWDTNVAFYASLSQEEQLQMIEMKRLDQVPQIPMVEPAEEKDDRTEEQKKADEEAEVKKFEEDKKKKEDEERFFRLLAEEEKKKKEEEERKKKAAANPPVVEAKEKEPDKVGEKKGSEAQQAEEAKKAEELKKAEEQKKAEELKKAEDAKKAEEAKKQA